MLCKEKHVSADRSLALSSTQGLSHACHRTQPQLSEGSGALFREYGGGTDPRIVSLPLVDLTARGASQGNRDRRKTVKYDPLRSKSCRHRFERERALDYNITHHPSPMAISLGA